MIEIFLILAFIGGLALILSTKSAKIVPRRCDENVEDRKHTWVIRFNNEDHKGYLVCKICGKLPGEG